MSKKLHYFDFNGIAESIRYILHYTKQEFEDIRYDINKWPNEFKYTTVPFTPDHSNVYTLLLGGRISGTVVVPTWTVPCNKGIYHQINKRPVAIRCVVFVNYALPYHQLPLYEEDGRKLIQSIAIAKYVSRGTGLVPDDPWQQALVESAVQNLYEFWELVVAVLYADDEARKQRLKKELFEETIPFYFSRLERDLKENGGYFSGKLSWGEFVLITMVESTNLFLKLQIEKDYPTIAARMEEIRNAPGVKEYIASRKPYVSHYDI